MQISTNKHTNTYKCIGYFPLHRNDCVSSMHLHNELIVTGTFMGVSQLILINKDEINNSYSSTVKTITELVTEHISCVYINHINHQINVGISSSQMMHVDIEKVVNSSLIENNNNNEQHDMNYPSYPINDKCKSKSKDCTCMIANDRLLIINTKFEDDADDPIQKVNFEYENRSLSGFDSKCGGITSTNYSVPFDFDGDRYVYIEYSSKTKRRLCVYYTLTFEQNSQIVVNLNESYGHISHLKLIQDDIVFLVKNLNECVIIELKTTKCVVSLDVLDAFTHLGKEIIASACYMNNNSCGGSLNAQTTNVGINLATTKNNVVITNEEKESANNDILVLNRQQTRANEEVDNSEGGLKVRVNDDEKCINKRKENILQNVQIVTVDLEGTVNMFYQGIENTLFNIYDMDDVNKDLKEKMLFDVGYPYYVAVNNMLLVVTTDYGVLVFAKQENDVI